MIKPTIRITKEGKKKIKKELNRLQREAAAIIEKIRNDIQANETEDAYCSTDIINHGEIQTRIDELTYILQHAEIVKPRRFRIASLGNKVHISSGQTELEYTLVDSLEADPADNRISVDSPLGSALFGRHRNETVRVRAPSGLRSYTILGIS